MKTIVLLFCMIVLFPVSSYAADAQKVAVVDIQKILNDSEAGKKAKADLETLIKSKQAHIDEQGNAIEKMKIDVEKQASVLSVDARKAKEDEIEKLIREYQRMVQDSQAELKKQEGALTEAILKEINVLVKKIGETEGYSIILEKGTVVYSDKRMDITDTVIKNFDELKSKSGK